MTNNELLKALTDEELKVLKSRVALKNNPHLEPSKTFEIVDTKKKVVQTIDFFIGYKKIISIVSLVSFVILFIIYLVLIFRCMSLCL